MAHRGGFVGEGLLRLIQLGAFEGLQARDLIQRQLGEKAQEPADIAVVRIAPILPVVVGAQHLLVDPDSALRRFAHLCTRSQREERRGQAVERVAVHTARKLDAVDDVAPLIGAAHLQLAIVAERQFPKIVCLQDHVVEFEKRHRLLALEAQLDALESQHPVDRKMPADLAQEFDIGQLVEPGGVVHHHGIGRAVAHLEKPPKRAVDARFVGSDILVRQQLARFVAPSRIANLGGAPAQEHDRPVAEMLKPAQHHDLHQASHVQAGCGTVEADIGRNGRVFQRGVERGFVGALMNEPARMKRVQKFGTKWSHLHLPAPHRRALVRRLPAFGRARVM